MKAHRVLIVIVGVAWAAAVCRAGQAGESRAQAYAQARALATLGRAIFFDASLSGSGRMSCASCHSPAHAFAAPNALAAERGGVDLTHVGNRAVPSLMYLQAAPPFAEHRFDDDGTGDDSVDSGPSGGLTWDGRVDRGSAQAAIPLLSPDEMANASAADVVAKGARASYAPALRAIGGADVFARPGDAFAIMLHALEVYEQDPSFYPYSSKYDAYLDGETTLAPAEQRGLVAFNDPVKGNCARCHPSERSAEGLPPQFTDYGFAAIGVPRNRDLPANRNPAYFDLGLCGPIRRDVAGTAAYCGMFMTPTLRNVATRQVFFHNGVITSLKQAVGFYATRDSAPETWYPRDASGVVRLFDDLPAKYRANLESGLPFGQRLGGLPALSPADVDDVVAFLRTLTDGFRPAASHDAPGTRPR